MELAEENAKLISDFLGKSNMLKLKRYTYIDNYRCGGRHLSSRCKHSNTICYNCKKQEHLARVCKTTHRQTANFMEDEERISENAVGGDIYIYIYIYI